MDYFIAGPVPDMTALNSELVNVLKKVKRPGTYYTRFQTEWHLPTIEIDGLGKLALPVIPQQAEQLTSVATLAPYGKGEETLLDTSVRNTWQIEARQVHISGKHWQPMLDTMLGHIKTALGVQGEVTASLYKLLVYGEGSFFVKHRDTEKEAGMFGSLIIALPSDYEGGELCLKHAGSEVRLDLRTDDASEIAFAAFYADCIHEVLPVTEGYRVVLAYNLCLKKQVKVLPKPPDYQAEQQQIADLLTRWTKMEEASDGEDIPLKLVYLLEHAYTPEGLAFSALKNGDAAIAGVMAHAAEQADCDCYLALLSVEEYGIADYYGDYYRRRRWGYNDADGSDDDFKIIEVTDWEQFISHWQQANGVSLDLAKLPFEDEELCLPERLKTLEPDRLEFQEATGNEGASFERTYRRAGLVVWPRQYAADALAVGGTEVTVPYLAARAQQWQADGQVQGDALWQENQQLARAIIRHWPAGSEYEHHRYDDEKMLGAFLEPLNILQDTASIEMALRQVAITGKAYQDDDNPTMMRTLALLPAETAQDLVAELVEKNAHKSLAACAGLMREVLPVYAMDDKQPFRPAASSLLANLPDNIPEATFYNKPKPPLNAAQTADTLAAIAVVDEAYGQQAVDELLAKRRSFPMDSVLIPATRMLAESHDAPGSLTHYLHKHCLAYLENEIGKPLEVPKDWARDADFKCPGDEEQTQDCQALKEFLRDPEQESWAFRANQQRRTSLEQIASHSELDVRMETIKKGSPHTLRFSKTDASYQKRVKQRVLDEKNRVMLLTLEI